MRGIQNFRAAEIEIANEIYQKEVFSSIAGAVFDSFYYKNEIKTVLTEDFMTAKPVKILEKLYRLAKFAYTEYQQGNKEDLVTRPACCYADRKEYFELCKELKKIGIFDFDETVKEGAKGTPTAMLGDITLTTKAKITFDNGIETAERFEEVFMDTKNGRDTFNFLGSINGGQNLFGGSHNAITNTISTTIIRNILKDKGILDQQITEMEPAIAEIVNECNEKTVNKSALQAIFSKIKEKFGKAVYDIVTQTISNLITGKINGQ